MKRATSPRWASVAALTCALGLVAEPASAHLIPARQGTVNVVGAAVYAVLSVPASSLRSLPEADDNHDGILDSAEFARHEATLRAEIDRRLVLLDGSTPGRTLRVDLMLSPDHAGGGDHADQIVALKHVELDAPPVDLRVHCDLFGARESERELTFTATRHPASGTETQMGVLRPAAPEHAFFPAVPQAPQPAVVGESSSLPRGWLGVGALLAIGAIGLGLASGSLARKPVAHRI